MFLHSLRSYLLTTWFGFDMAVYFDLRCRRMVPAVYVDVACCRSYYFYIMSLISGEYWNINVHIRDILVLHTFIPHCTLHSAEKICIKFSANYPLTTSCIRRSAFCKIPLPTSWCIQNLSKCALNRQTVSTSTTELGRLFQVLTIRAE